MAEAAAFLRHTQPVDVSHPLTGLVKMGIGKPWVFVVFPIRTISIKICVVAGEGWWRRSYFVQNVAVGLFYLIFSEVLC